MAPALLHHASFGARCRKSRTNPPPERTNGMGISRRSLLKGVAAGSAATVLAPAEALADTTASDQTVGMLYDATRCVGCKACMAACNEANQITPDTASSDGRAAMPVDLNEHALNIIKMYKDPESGQHSYIKRQCMHCTIMTAAQPQHEQQQHTRSSSVCPVICHSAVCSSAKMCLPLADSRCLQCPTDSDS